MLPNGFSLPRYVIEVLPLVPVAIPDALPRLDVRPVLSAIFVDPSSVRSQTPLPIFVCASIDAYSMRNNHSVIVSTRKSPCIQPVPTLFANLRAFALVRLFVKPDAGLAFAIDASLSPVVTA